MENSEQIWFVIFSENEEPKGPFSFDQIIE